MINIDGHEFQSRSTGGRPIKVNYAQCSCGAQYNWGVREAEHEQHALAVVWDEGYRAAQRDDLDRTDTANPYVTKEADQS